MKQEIIENEGEEPTNSQEKEEKITLLKKEVKVVLDEAKILSEVNKLPSALTIDFDSLKDKPWEAEGADISDYFNYGFDEEIFRIYQSKVRDSYLSTNKEKIKDEIIEAGFGLDHPEANFYLPHECGGVGKSRVIENFHIEEDDVPVLCKFHGTSINPGGNPLENIKSEGYYIKQLRGNHRTMMPENGGEDGEGDGEMNQFSQMMMPPITDPQMWMAQMEMIYGPQAYQFFLAQAQAEAGILDNQSNNGNPNRGGGNRSAKKR